MQYPIIDLISKAYLNNGWTGLDIPETITYEPIQLGSGDPSPTNIRPILPATTLNIGGNDVPVYGGTLNTSTKILTVTHRLFELSSVPTNSWAKSNTFPGGFFANNQVTEPVGTFKGYTPFICTHAKTALFISEYLYGTCFSDNSISFRLMEAESTVSDWVNYVTEQNMNNTPINICGEVINSITYQLTETELISVIGIKDDIAHRLKLPLPHYFPHPVIDALQRASAGTQTADDTEILRHYLTPLGIGGI